MNTMNRIEFHYPPFESLPPQEKNLDLKVNFKENGYLIAVNVEAIIFPGSPPPEYRGEYIIKRFRFIVEEGSRRKGTLSKLAENPDKHPELVKLLASFINVVLRNIRNFGMIPHINEIYPIYHDAKTYLTGWKAAISMPDGSWRELIPGPKELDLLLWFLYPFFYEESRKFPLMIEPDKWEDIKFAIQTKREPPPEQEFMTNAMEFLRLNNLRLALLESITCLEIVLSQYLEAYLEIYKEVPKKRINKLLKPPGIGLTARISALLDLTLNPNDLARINIDDVVKAVEWRNNILHRTGGLPKNLNPEDVKNKIRNVLELAYILSERRDQIKASPEMKNIAEEISKEYNIPVPKIGILRNHNILMEFVFFDKELLPTGNTLNELIKSISDRLSKRDKLFKANKHLHISFIKFPKEVLARWHQGKFVIIKKEQSIN